MHTSERTCLEALRQAAAELGESPTKAQYEELGLQPASGTIMRVLGGWNAAKEAAGLRSYYSRGSRIEPPPEDVDLPENTTWETLTVDQRWHYRNVERNGQRTVERRSRLRAWAYEYKRDHGGCQRCDEDDPACLDFHHVDSENKEMAIGKMITNGYAKGRLLEEIEKCVILCANCHRKEHYTRPEPVEKR